MNTQTTKKTSRSIKYDQGKIDLIQEQLNERIADLLEYFGCPYKKNKRIYYTNCPIHEGDGKRAFNIYHYEGNGQPVIYKCRSNNCNKIFKNGLLNMIRGVLSRTKYGWKVRGDQEATFMEAVAFALDFLEQDYDKLTTKYVDLEKRKFVQQMAEYNQGRKVNQNQLINREKVRAGLMIPSKYLLGS